VPTTSPSFAPERPLFVAVLTLACAATIAPTANAQSVPGYPADVRAYDSREVALLPPYCKHTQDFREKVPGGSDAGAVERWKLVFGPTYEAMHHYCWGLMKTHRGAFLARSRQSRDFYLADSLNEFEYVIERAGADFILLPEILTKKGENLIRLGRGPVGVLELERAAELKPDYWPPYAYMSDYYKSVGDLKLARESLQRGLSFSSDAQALKRRVIEIEAATEKRKGSQ
jgi:tetratricopeptide (TPR) repeat protein